MIQHLNNSRAAARTLGELAETLNVPRRSIEIAVQQARLAGVPVVSGPQGLWVSNDADEVLRAAEALRTRLVTQYATYRALRATGRRMSKAVGEQGTLWAA